MRIGTSIAIVASALAVAHAAQAPSIYSLGGLDIVVDNQLDPSHPPQSLIASHKPKSYDQAKAICAALGESLADLSKAANLNLADTKLPADSTFWIAGTTSGSECPSFRTSSRSGKSKSHLGKTACGSKQYALCTNSAGKTTKAGENGSQHQIRTNTNDGPIIGFRDNLTWKFLGIPYAKPPVDDLRFAAPQPPKKWTEPLQATNFTNTCVQADGTGSEDCLYLNVYTPTVDKCSRRKSLLPVMYWVHGGGYTGGSAMTTLYDGSNIASRGDVVVVSINYRLNIFGFAEDTAHYDRSELPGNLALRDQIAGLQWVKENVERFGGNPDSVTIFGESAGGSSIRSLVQSPKATGLFHKAISESDPWDLGWQTPADAGNLTQTVWQGVQCTDLACARKASIADLTASFNKAVTLVSNVNHPQGEFNFVEPVKPSIDGEYIPHDWHTSVKKGEFNKVPFLITTNHDEAGAFITEDLPNPVPAAVDSPTLDQTWAYLLSTVIHFGVERTTAIIKSGLYPYYSATQPDIIRDQLNALITDFFWNCPLRLFVEQMAGHGVKVYRGRFDHVLQETNAPTSYCYNKECHGSELTTVFGALNIYGIPVSAEDLKFTQNIVDTWTHFARYSNPNTHNQLYWPAATTSKSNVYVFNSTNTLLTDGFNNDKCDFFQKNDMYDFDIFDKNYK
ncbi:Carboxylesterase family-domain-containing protein [Umbelopsis sp. AD052]|nr:Carboxylesterase family-domain-containing protein [Umbelopsis sp. AD052]